MATRPILGKRDWITLRRVIVGVLVVWSIVFSLPWLALWTGCFTLKSQAEVERFKSLLGQLGTYGDMFGMVNALFSAFALAGAIISVMLQTRELSYQRKE